MNTEKIGSTVKQNALLIIAVILMIIPLIIAFSFILPASGWFWWHKEENPALLPDFISGALAIAIYSAVIIRSDMSMFKNPVKVILAVLNITFIASFSKTFLSASQWSIFGVKISISSQTFAIICVALSWLGMKTIAGFSWIILFIASITTLTEINNAMGFSGFIYIISAFLSIGMQMAGGYISMNSDNLKTEFFTVSNTIKSDINQSIDTTKNAVNSAIGVAKMAAGIPNIPTNQNAKIETKEKGE